MQNRNKRLFDLVQFTGLVAGAVLSVSLMVTGLAHGVQDHMQREEFDYDESQDIPWIENETEVLALPSEEDLSRVDIDQIPEGMELLIDKKRIDVNPDDEVVRVWLWVRSDGGANNVTYEGFRCATREYKVYAYANPRRDPPVSKAKNPRWIKVKEAAFGNYRRELLQDYFCDTGRTRNAHEIRDYLTGAFRPSWRWITN